MANPVNIALVGMGWWGQKMLAVLQAAPADIRVVRAVEPNLETVRDLCAQFPDEYFRKVDEARAYPEAFVDALTKAVAVDAAMQRAAAENTIAITQGDPSGIGPEIVAKAFRDAPEVLRLCFVVGDVATLRRAAQAIARPGVGGLPVAQISAPHEALAMPPRCVPVLPVPGIPGPQPWGQVSAAAGRAAADAVVWATRAALRGAAVEFRSAQPCGLAGDA